MVLAESVEEEDGTYRRVYPAGDLASHIVGYASDQYGTAGIEQSYNQTLKGERNFASWTDVLKSLAGSGVDGNDVTLTINSTIQQAAQDALAGNVGACVVLDPETGAVLAMASSPTYDASQFGELLQAAAEGNAEDDSAMLNRATLALYAPGIHLQDGVAGHRFGGRRGHPRHRLRRPGHHGHRQRPGHEL